MTVVGSVPRQGRSQVSHTLSERLAKLLRTQTELFRTTIPKHTTQPWYQAQRG